MSAQADSWDRAALSVGLLLFAPRYLAGAVIRMRASPDRNTVLDSLANLSTRRLHPAISDEQLFGGLDLSETLKHGQLIENNGFFNNPCAIMLTMAERCGPELAAKLAHQLDRHAGHCFLALDEGAEPDEAAPPALTERLPFHIAPEGKAPAGWAPVPAGTAPVPPREVACTQGDLEALTMLAARFGIDSLRAPLLALRVARAHAGMAGRNKLHAEDLEAAACLVFPQRATRMPAQEDAEEDAPAPPETETGTDAGMQNTSDLPDGDMLVDAVKALLPADLLAGLVPAGTLRSSQGDGAGQKRKGNRRGRPLPSRPGRLDGRSRIDLVATLRAAAPWQPMRRAAQPSAGGLLIRPSDIRLKRYQEQSDRLLIFAVDASGSAAVSRLNEAKGAVELLLAQAYAARDHVALVSFRGTEGEILLPPTRSLVQTKRRLASLPGGGGTPLATGLQQAAALATQSRGKGLTPTIVVLTDGRANIALDGSADRTHAAADAARMARVICAQGIQTLTIDVSKRPQPALKALAEQLGGPYLALPRADARTLTGAVSAALEA
ncbi:magnesium chelatase subunit D [Roseobacter sp. YSTF-M11]|uniref:Magnesium chelatase subunit D n=1 Tax=Roseobacter insulae TaxID=2859783 RepID=A0A9X1FUR5_9RHOB|nr:magnesium chelatase subunit D [Roseobacter insulae]MBW4708305.1 magnesium chelatase subunit D [Roseobacter insulae]